MVVQDPELQCYVPVGLCGTIETEGCPATKAAHNPFPPLVASVVFGPLSYLRAPHHTTPMSTSFRSMFTYDGK